MPIFLQLHRLLPHTTACLPPPKYFKGLLMKQVPFIQLITCAITDYDIPNEFLDKIKQSDLPHDFIVNL